MGPFSTLPCRVVRVGVLLLPATLLAEQFTAPRPNREGLLRIDVAIEEQSGHRIPELRPRDFTLLDDDRPTRIYTIQFSREKDMPPESPPELIFVFDDEALPTGQTVIEIQQFAKFLRQDAGVLSQPVLFYRISHDGVFASAKPWLDGNAAAAELETRSEPRLVSRGPESLSTLLMNRNGPHTFNEVGTLGLIAIDQRSTPGRKMLVWFGDASSPIANDRCTENLAAELSTWLREARITVNVLSMIHGSGRFATDQDFLAAEQQVRAKQRATLAISAVAAHTGGLTFPSGTILRTNLNVQPPEPWPTTVSPSIHHGPSNLTNITGLLSGLQIRTSKPEPAQATTTSPSTGIIQGRISTM